MGALLFDLAFTKSNNGGCFSNKIAEEGRRYYGLQIKTIYGATNRYRYFVVPASRKGTSYGRSGNDGTFRCSNLTANKKAADFHQRLFIYNLHIKRD